MSATGKPEHPLVEPGGSEHPVEQDGVVADEKHQDPYAPLLSILRNCISEP
jgi:hypothetical protein